MIETSPLFALLDGRMIAETLSGGEIVIGRDRDGGERRAAYQPGSLLLLLDAAGQVVAGPIDARGAFNLALAVANGDPRALTQPQATLTLAVSVLALLAPRAPEENPPEASPPASAAEVA
jgi:hypothetical protein